MTKVYKKAASKVKEGRSGKFVDQYAPKGKSAIAVQGSYKANTKVTIAEEPIVVYTSRIRAIGNSKGVILNNNLIESAGLKQDIDIVIQAKEGVIIIMQTKETDVNTNLASWDKQFKAAIKKGAKPEGDMFEGMNNDFDKKEW